MITANNAKEFLEYYGYNATERAIQSIFDIWAERKANLRSILSKHPNWNDDAQAIIFTEDFQTGINNVDLTKFSNWLLIKANYMDVWGYITDKGSENTEKYQVMWRIRNLNTSFAEEEWCDAVNRAFDLQTKPGQKNSRIINKIGKALGIDTYKEYKTIFQNGENREKDFGWNYHFAMLGDALNPIYITKYTVISINPMDYWTMSFGKKWASCHTIDKENIRGTEMNGRHTYEGCYSGGCNSYMLDKTSVVFYTVDKDWEDEMWKAPKDRRMMFHINDENEFVFGRIYPDGRDGGETGMAAQFRQCVQKVLSDCSGECNLWTVTKGTDVCREHTYTVGAHYRDYTSYEDCGYCVRKGYDVNGIVNIGAWGICPSCGRETDNEKSICCENCYDDYEYHCAVCGDGIRDDEGYYCEDTNEVYCCIDCAEEDGCVWTDDGLHLRENCFEDSRTGEWYYGEPEVYTEDGNTYYSRLSAERDGYACTDDGEWYPEEEIFCDDETEEYFHEDEDTIFIDNYVFRNKENARSYGFIDIDGEWYAEDQTLVDHFSGEYFVPNENSVITEYGNFTTKENAKRFGLIECEGEWYRVWEAA